MRRFSCLFVLFAVSQIVRSQGPPPPPPPFHENQKCHFPPRMEISQNCCQTEPMFGDEELASCGFRKLGEGGDEQKRGAPPDCSKPTCLLKKKGFIDEEGNIKFSEVSTYLESWGGDSFKDAVGKANTVCLADGKVPGPPQICEPGRLVHCVGSVVFENCPEDKWLQTDDCKTLKEYIEECKPPGRN